MKVVLFCGGYGMRMREFSEDIPKPMVPIGTRPVLWHLMRYYAHFGHNDFIICLGYKGEAIKDYFLGYREEVSNDFVLSEGGRRVELLGEDIADWRITFVDTGLAASVGERLLAVRPHLEGEEEFLANYADGLSDVHLPDLIAHAHENDSIATFVCVKPGQTFHVVRFGEDDAIAGLDEASATDLWINGGFFVLRREIFEHLHEGEELVVEAFQRLAKLRRLTGFRHEGFWAGMDTFKDRARLDELSTHGGARWKVWERSCDR
ncbi:glucose-1-phosphate cytidylyltransferase [Egibacter rhizosphaerae]|uniref:Glucose-1-phosphate cytidylyltransferase n=1 Tax=Egibacter rhizosphaerae TaxID=1670831 RepID=A0A411YGM0_9ACTN|nr:sugar phosphate nucleotidyltransferase [Egibacter rhizosphaerae]QBI20291.1 glucose-1-phosphate cytidylyltransferase [Egibacter rhizosphaerae]